MGLYLGFNLFHYASMVSHGNKHLFVSLFVFYFITPIPVCHVFYIYIYIYIILNFGYLIYKGSSEKKTQVSLQRHRLLCKMVKYLYALICAIAHERIKTFYLTFWIPFYVSCKLEWIFLYLSHFSHFLFYFLSLL